MRVDRIQDEDFMRIRTIGTNKLEKCGFEILIKNQKSVPIQLNIYDQLPVPAINSIVVSPDELSNGILEEESGQITWKVDLKPDEKKSIIFRYQVKYPKREDVYLE